MILDVRNYLMYLRLWLRKEGLLEWEKRSQASAYENSGVA
jgi:hypothetical protein